LSAARSAADLRRLCAAADGAFAHGTLWQTRKDCRQIPRAGTYHLADSGLGAIAATRAPTLSTPPYTPLSNATQVLRTRTRRPALAEQMSQTPCRQVETLIKARDMEPCRAVKMRPWRLSAHFLTCPPARLPYPQAQIRVWTAM